MIKYYTLHRLFFFTLLLICSVFTKIKAQNINFTQFHLTPIQTNPALIATNNQAQFLYNFRNQSVGGQQAFTTHFVSGIYPIFLTNNDGNKQRKMGIGLSFLNDASGPNGVLKHNGLGLSFAYNFNLTPTIDSTRAFNKYISLGIQGRFVQRSFDVNSLTSGNQFDFTLGQFAPDLLDIGEPLLLTNNNTSYPIINAGALFYLTDNCGDKKVYFGINIQNINQPDIAFIGSSSKLPLSITTIGGYSFDINNFRIQPNFRWIQEGNTNQIRFGALGYYRLNTYETEKAMQIGLGVWYDENKSLVFGTDFSHKNFSIGASYDLGAFNPINTLNSQVFEINLAIKFKKKCIDKIIEKNNEQPLDTLVETITEEEEKEDSVTIHTIKNTKIINLDTQEVISENSDTLSSKTIAKACDEINFEALKKSLKRKISFFYLSDDINQNSDAILTKITDFLKQCRNIKIRIIGHTCNIGGDMNQSLSQKRAEKVKNFFVERGINPERFITEGRADKEPILSNKSEYGRIMNRRVEFMIEE